MTWRYQFPADIEGYMGEEECLYLYHLACKVPRGGAVVELGSYKGRSAVAMAQSGRFVWAIDRFTPEPEDFNPLPDHKSGNFFANDIKANAERYDVRVRVIEADTNEAYRFWLATNKPPIFLLHIDADHNYEAVKQDFEQWSQFVVEDGVIVFDDSLWPGVQQLLMEIEDWAPIPGPQVGGLTAMQRVKETANARA
jgi:predicted O-methyltransferase YrrM